MSVQVTLTKKKKKKLGMAPNKVAVCASLIIKKAYYKEAEKIQLIYDVASKT